MGSDLWRASGNRKARQASQKRIGLVYHALSDDPSHGGSGRYRRRCVAGLHNMDPGWGNLHLPGSRHSLGGFSPLLHIQLQPNYTEARMAMRRVDASCCSRSKERSGDCGVSLRPIMATEGVEHDTPRGWPAILRTKHLSS